MALAALPDVREDAERRARGVSLEDWLNAPSFAELGYTTRGDCEGGLRPCPALRCKFNLGRVGERAGFTCYDDVANLPDGERTLDLIGRLMGVTLERVIGIEKSARHAVESQDPEVLLALGVRRRHA